MELSKKSNKIIQIICETSFDKSVYKHIFVVSSYIRLLILFLIFKARNIPKSLKSKFSEIKSK